MQIKSLFIELDFYIRFNILNLDILFNRENIRKSLLFLLYIFKAIKDKFIRRL